MQLAQHDLDLVVLARVVPVQGAVDQQPGAGQVDLAGDQRLQARRLVVEVLQVIFLLRRAASGSNPAWRRAARQP
jgi:hypothetical protein